MSIDIGRRAAKHDYGDLFAPYTGVTINLTDGDTSFTSGDDSGRTLTVESPWASQKMADNLLAQVRGAQHQPFTATGAILDPAAELGDAITVGGVSGIMYRRSQRFGTLYRADISAPGDEEINHEIPYYPPVKRALNRVGGVARGAAGAAAESLKRQDGIEEDFKTLAARVTDVSAGMEAYVRNETFDDYKLSVTRLFAEVNDDSKDIKAELSLQSTSIDGLQLAQSELADRVGAAEASLTQKAESSTAELLDGRLTKTETAQADLTARVGSAESALKQKADSATVTDLEGRVTAVETSESELTSRVGNAETSLKLKANRKDVEELEDRVTETESATADLTTRIGNAETGLTNKVSTGTFNSEIAKKLDVSAASEIYARKDSISASIGAYIMADGKSLADIQADLVTISGKTTLLGKLSVADGGAIHTDGLTASSIVASTLTVTGSINGNERTTISSGTLAGARLTISGTVFSTVAPLTVVTSFTQALGEQAPTKEVTLLASIVKTETTVDALPGETIAFAA